MKQVGLYEAKSRLSALVSALIESGDPVSLTKHGKVVAEIRRPGRQIPSRGRLAEENFYISPEFDHPELPSGDSNPPRVDDHPGSNDELRG